MCVIAGSASLAAACSCSLIYDYDNCPDGFAVASDWAIAPEAEPESMAYMFFSWATADVWRYDFPGRQGGEVPLPDGLYRSLCFNDDSAVTTISDPSEGYESIRATTPATTLHLSLGGPDSLDGQKVRSCPTQLWGQSIAEARLTDEGVSWTPYGSADKRFSDEKILTYYPHPLMARYSYEVSDIVNLKGARRITAALTGMASAIYLAREERTGPPATLPFGASKLTDTSIGGSFLSMGLPDHPTVANHLWIYVWLTDGRKFSYRFDVTDQARKAPDPMNVHLKVAGIDLPESEPATEGGFDVNVDGWVVEIIDINS